jgi:hypothetical protein
MSTTTTPTGLDLNAIASGADRRMVAEVITTPGMSTSALLGRLYRPRSYGWGQKVLARCMRAGYVHRRRERGALRVYPGGVPCTS